MAGWTKQVISSAIFLVIDLKFGMHIHYLVLYHRFSGFLKIRKIQQKNRKIKILIFRNFCGPQNGTPNFQNYFFGLVINLANVCKEKKCMVHVMNFRWRIDNGAITLHADLWKT